MIEPLNECDCLVFCGDCPGIKKGITRPCPKFEDPDLRNVNEATARAARAAEAAVQRKDAERYRWLRAQNWNDGLMCVVARPAASVKLGSDCPSLIRLDATIDAAIAQAVQP